MSQALPELNSKIATNKVEGENISPVPVLGYANFLMDYENGIILYRGTRFSMARWPHVHPPQFIWSQGRAAKESFSPYNNPSPGKCCGSKLLLDDNDNYYCPKCSLIYDPFWEPERQTEKEKTHDEELRDWKRWIDRKLD